MNAAQAAYRGQFVTDAVATASPAKLLTMLYDRLVLDLVRSETAFRDGESEAGSNHLLHAQEIIIELRCSLDVDAWTGGPGLAALYGYLLTELIRANIARDADSVERCRGHVEPLRDAWTEAALRGLPYAAAAS
jgi:flagellar protein FliS